jgi:DNA-binding NarL/FixJ family response regulator
MTTLKLLLADDDAMVRAGLRAVLDSEDDLEVIGEAADGSEAVTLAAELRPDVVIMDIRMPHLDGLAATGQIVASGDAAPRVLVLTTFELDEYVLEALRAGAGGFLLKRASPEDLVEAVRVVASGESLLFPPAMRLLVSRYAATGEQADRLRANLDLLTEREREVLRLVARGRSNRDIADELFVGHETVKSHVGSVLMKLGVQGRTQAVIAAYESGFVRKGEADPTVLADDPGRPAPDSSTP